MTLPIQSLITNGGEQYIVGLAQSMKVPVQFHKWSHDPRLVKVVEIKDDSSKIKEWEGSFWIQCQIVKGQKGAGRKFWFRIPRECVLQIVRQEIKTVVEKFP